MKAEKRGIRLILISVLVCLWGVFPASAAQPPNEIKTAGFLEYMETVYDESSGMIASEANAVLQDSQGYLWVGSYGGLGRYTGKEFENMSLEREGAPQSGIRALFEDTEGRIWIGTNDAGLFVFEQEAFYTVGDPDLSVRSMAQDPEGLLYIGTTNGLFLMDESRSLLPVWPELLQEETVVDLAAGLDGRMAGLTASGILFTAEAGMPGEAWGQDSFGAELGDGIYVSDAGELYLGTEENFVLRLPFPSGSDGLGQAESLSIGSLKTVNDMYRDSQGRLWVCTDNGVGYFDSSDVFSEIQGLCSDSIITDLCEDYEGNLWFASSRRGLFQFSKGKFKNVSYKAGIAGQTVNAAALYRGRLYVGTDQGLTVMGADGELVENELTALLQGIRIRSFMTDREDQLWIASYRDYGLIRYHEETGEIQCFTEAEGLPRLQTRTAIQLSDGRIAAATNGGVAVIENGQVTETYAGAQDLHNEVILCLAEGKDQTLYAGSDGNGIYKIDLKTGEVENISADEGLVSGVILRMVSDPEAGGIWISNGTGLSFMDENGIRTVDLPQAGAGSILDMKLTEDSVWLIKSFGLLRADRESLLSGQAEFETFSRKDGLTSSVTANSWNVLSPDGQLFLCTGNGIYYMDTNRIYFNKTIPKVAVSHVQTDEGMYYGVQDISLPASNQRITIQMDLLSFSFAGGELEYYLEGFDKAPVRADGRTENQVSYTNLPGGDYVFHVKGRNADGVESGELTFRLKKERSVFEKQYVFVCVALGGLLLFMAALVLVQHYNRKRILRRQREYKNLTDQTVRIVARTIDAKDAYTNGHSYRVAEYAAEIGRRYGLSEEQLEQLYYSALLHDIGKIGIPDRILNKKGKLSEEEYAAIKNHPVIGGRILEDFTLVPWISDGAKYHHERYDGTGYNEGLKGEEIPLYARIISVADAFDGMNSTRVYRVGMTTEVICGELEKGKGTQFDPVFADIMLEMIGEGLC